MGRQERTLKSKSRFGWEVNTTAAKIISQNNIYYFEENIHTTIFKCKIK